MNRIRLLFVFVLFNFSVYADIAFAEKNFCELPLRLSSNGLPETEVQIGKEKIPLILDTGCSETAIMLNPKILKRNGVRMLSKKGNFQDICGEVYPYRHFRLPYLKFGNKVIENIEGHTFDKLWGGGYNPQENRNSQAAKNGVIGLSLLRYYAGMILDYKKNKLILLENETLPPAYAYLISEPMIKFKYAPGMVSKCLIEDVPVFVEWDTGASYTFLKPSVLKKLRGKVQSKKVRFNGYKIYKLNAFSYEGSFLTELKTFLLPKSTPFNQDGLIGNCLFLNKVVYFNFKKAYLKCEPVKSGLVS